MKLIVVQWIVDPNIQYGREMRVIYSDHPRFSKGRRFDFGFFSIATEEGYNILSISAEDNLTSFNRELKLDYLLKN